MHLFLPPRQPSHGPRFDALASRKGPAAPPRSRARDGCQAMRASLNKTAPFSHILLAPPNLPFHCAFYRNTSIVTTPTARSSTGREHSGSSPAPGCLGTNHSLTNSCSCSRAFYFLVFPGFDPLMAVLDVYVLLSSSLLCGEFPSSKPFGNHTHSPFSLSFHFTTPFLSISIRHSPNEAPLATHQQKHSICPPCKAT